MPLVPEILLAELTPYETGRLTGRLFGAVGFTVLLLGLALWSFKRMKRPGHSPRCYLAVGILLLGFVLSSLATTLIPILSGSGHVRLLAGSAGILLVIALVLAVFGLVERVRHRDRFHKGGIPAGITLLLGGLLMLIGISGAVKARQRVLAQQTPGGESVAVEQFNFKMTMPGAPWVQMDASKVNATSAFAMMRRDPAMHFLVIAERPGVTAGIDNTALVEVVKANLRSVASSSELIREAPLRLGQLSGVEVETRVVLHGHSFFYKQWICVTNGYAFQLAAWGGAADESWLRGESRKIFERFELMDFNRVVSGENAAGDFESKKFRYRVEFAGTGWRQWPEILQQFPEAEFGALGPSQSGFAVVPLSLRGREVPLEPLTAGLLGTMDIAYPDEQLTGRSPVVWEGFQGQEFAYRRRIGEQEFEYRLRVLKGAEFAYLVAAWISPSDDGGFLSHALNRFSPLPIQEPAESRPFTNMEIERHVKIFNLGGLYSYRGKDFETAMQLFASAANLSPTNTVLLKNFADASLNGGQFARGLEFLDQQQAATNPDLEVRAWQALLQARAGRVEDAAASYGALFASGYRQEDQFKEYIGLLLRANDHAQALVEVNTYLQDRDSTEVRLLKSRILTQQGEWPAAISLLKEERSRKPSHLGIPFELAEALLAAAEMHEAYEICRELIRSGNESAYAHFLMGRAEYGLKWYREAKSSFESALAKAPDNPDIKSFLAHVSAMLGEGSNTSLKNPIEPVLIPEELIEPPLAAFEPRVKGHGAWYVHRVTAIDYVPEKEFKQTELRLVRILDSSGVAQFSTVQIGFDPLTEELFVNRLQARNSEGEVVAEGNVSDYYVLDETGGQAATHKKVLNIPIPGLQPGHTIELKFTRRDLAKAKEFRFVKHPFSAAFPTARSILYLRGGTTGLAIGSTGASISGPRALGDGSYWLTEDPAIFVWEPYAVETSDYLPTLWLGDGSADWNVLGAEYLAQIRDRLTLSAELAGRARDLVQTVETPKEKAIILARYVQEQCRYVAIEFGLRGRIPRTPMETVQTGYGDCKDHSVLLQQMLATVGVPARLALVNSQDRIYRPVASLDQFDHMIVFVPAERGGWFVDCTDKGLDLSLIPPLGLAEREALVLDAGGCEWVRIPAALPDSSRLSIHRTLRKGDRGELLVRETLAYHGHHSGFWRGILKPLQPSARWNWFKEQVGASGAELTGFEIEHLEDRDRSLILRIEYSLARRFHELEGQWVVQLPAIWERRHLALQPLERRISPFDFRFPLTIESRVEMPLPDGFAAPDLNELKHSADSPWLKGRTLAAVESNVIQLDSRFEQLPGRFPVGDYEACRSVTEGAVASLEARLVFPSKGTRP